MYCCRHFTKLKVFYLNFESLAWCSSITRIIEAYAKMLALRRGMIGSTYIVLSLLNNTPLHMKFLLLNDLFRLALARHAD